MLRHERGGGTGGVLAQEAGGASPTTLQDGEDKLEEKTVIGPTLVIPYKLHTRHLVYSQVKVVYSDNPLLPNNSPI